MKRNKVRKEVAVRIVFVLVLLLSLTAIIYSTHLVYANGYSGWLFATNLIGRLLACVSLCCLVFYEGS